MQGRWYVVFHGRVLGVYSSWKACNAQVSGFKNYRYKGFKTRHEAKDAYSKAGLKQAYISGKVDRLFGLKNFIIFIQFVAIAVLWCWCAAVRCR